MCLPVEGRCIVGQDTILHEILKKKKLLVHDRLNKFDKHCDFEVIFEKRKGIGSALLLEFEIGTPSFSQDI